MHAFLQAVIQWLRLHKEPLAAVQSALTSLAILTGGTWALYTFWWKRERYPKAKLGHSLGLVPLPDGRQLLRTELTIENVGDKLLELPRITCRIHQVLPLLPVDGKPFAPMPTKEGPEVIWPLIGKWTREFVPGDREVEPKENDEFQFDFVLGPEVATVIVYFFVLNPAKAAEEIGWELTETVSLATLKTPPPP